jgi:transcriptional regulator with XRE-family HTH domain
MLEPEQVDELRQVPLNADTRNRVADAIRLAGLTQKRVAEDLQMTESHLSDICRGRFRNPRLDTLQRLASYFGCSIEDLFPRGVAA